MIEEELAPVYTNAQDETPSLELPQMPIAGGVEDDFVKPILDDVKKMVQDEADPNVKLQEVNIENKRRKLSAIAGDITSRSDHSEQEKVTSVQNWIIDSTGRLPKNHTEMQFAMDKLWKRSGKEGLAPSYEAIFDTMKERFDADKKDSERNESLFEAGAKSVWDKEKPKAFLDNLLSDKSLTPEQRKIIKYSFDQGVAAQNDRYPQSMVVKINQLIETANSIKSERSEGSTIGDMSVLTPAGLGVKIGEEVGKKAAKMAGIAEGEISYTDIGKDMVQHTKDMTSEQKGLFISGLRERILADPEYNKNAADALKKLGLNFERSGNMASYIVTDTIPDFLKKSFSDLMLTVTDPANKKNISRAATAFGVQGANLLLAPTLKYIDHNGGLSREYFVEEHKKLVHEISMKNQVRSMLTQEYDPIQLFSKQDSFLSLIEQGVYQSPSVMTSFGLASIGSAAGLLGAPAGIAALGAGVSTISVGAMTLGEIGESQRQGYSDSGLDFDRAAEKGYGAINYAAAVPHMAIEYLKVGTFLRSIKGMKKVMSVLDKTVRSRPLRFTAKGGVLGAAGTAEEMAQDTWTEFLKDISHAIDGEMDKPEWFGEGAFFDDFWARSVTTFTSLGGISMASAAGGINMEDRASAWAELPPLLRQAAGHQLKDIEALDNAKSPQEKVKAYIESERNKDGQSPLAKEAIEGWETAQTRRALEIQDAQNKGLFPKTEFQMLEGKPNIKVFDPETNDIIIETESFEDAYQASFDWWGKKEEDFEHESIYLKTAFEAATMVAQQLPELVQRMSPSKDMTDVQFKLENNKISDEVADKSETNEKINGGDGSVSRVVFGANRVLREKGQTKIINDLFAGMTVETILHEAGHGFFKKGISDGTIDLEDAIKTLKRIDKAFQGRFTKPIKFVDKEGVTSKRPVEDMRLLPDTDNPTFQMVDEGMAQLYSALILNEGKFAPYRKLINDSMGSYAKMQGGSKIANFISAMRYYFNLALSRAVALKGMVRRGEIDQKDLDKVRAWMQGTTVQEEIAGEAQKEFDTYGIDDTAFSTGKPYKDRSGDEAGEPLTETEIKEGIEDESGTVVEPEIDDDEFLNAPEVTTDASFSTSSEVPIITRESLAGKRKFAYMSDRTRVGVYEGLHPESKIRIDLQGGWKYPYIVAHKKSGAAWAFTDLGMATRFINRINKTDGIGLTTLYAKGNLVANHTFLKAYMEEAAWSIKSGDITEERFLEVANQMRESANKSKKGGKPFIPLDTEAGKLFSKKWTKLSHMEQALDSASFEVRSNKFFAYNEKKVGENKGAKIGSDSLVAEGFPNISKMVDLFADPDLEGLPRGTVVGAIQFDKDQSGGVSAKDIGAEEHISYPVVVTGKPLGAFDKPIYILDVIKTNKKVNQALRSVEVKMADVSFSIGAAQDADYLAAVEAGDTTKQQAMVDEAAKAAGYDSPKVYHGTNANAYSDQDFTVFATNQERGASFFSSSEDLASSYGEQVYSIRLKLENPFVVDAKGSGWSSLGDADIISELSPEYLKFKDDQLKDNAELLERIGKLLGTDMDSTVSVDEAQTKKVGDLSGSRNDIDWVGKFARKYGYDGAIVKNVKDAPLATGYDNPIQDTYLALNPNQIKSADPVTYDSDGNVIPLSQRFDAGRDEISYSQGWQPEIRESILTNVESRMSTPQMKAEVIGDIQRRVQKLINDRRSFEKGMVVGDKTAKGEAKRIRSMIVTYEAILLALPTDVRGKMGSIVTIVDPNSEKQVLEFFDKKLNKLEKVVDRWVYGKFNVSRDRLFKRALAKPKAGEKDKGKLVGEMGAVINKNFEAAKEAMDLSEAEVDGKVAEIDKIIESKLAAGTLTTDLENELESKKNLIDMFGNWKNLTNSDREAALKFGWREFEYAYLMSTIEKARRREELAMKADELIKATGIPMEDIEKEADKRREGMGRLFGRIKAARYGFYDFEQVMSSVFPDAKQVVDKVIQEQQADAQFHDRMKEHQEGVERFFGTLVGDSFLSMKALKLQDKMQTVFFKVEGGGIKRELTQMQMIQARLMWRQEDGRRHMENWADEEKGQTNYSQEFMDALEGEMIPESKSLENYLISQYELEYDRLNAVYERMYGVSLPKNLFYSPLTVDPLQDISDKAVADPLSGQDISMMGSYNPSLLRRSKTAAAKPAFRDALATFYAHKNQIEYWMAYAEFVRELRSIIGNRDVRDAVKAKGGEEAVEMLKKWVNALDAGGLKSSALASQLNSFIGRSVNRTSSAILAGRLSTLAIQSTQAGAALAQMPTKDYVWRMGKLLSGNLEFAEAFNSKFIQRRLREAPPAVKMAMQGMASGSPTIAKEAAQKLGTLISGADAFFTAGTYAIIYDYLTTKKGMESTEAHTEATRLTEQVAQPTRMARRSMVELQQSQIALSKLSWAFASETRQKIALSAYRWDSKFTLAEKTRAIAVTFGFGGVFAQIVRSVGADLRDDDDDEIFDEKYWNPARMALKALLDPLTGVPVYGDLLQSTIMGAAKVAGVDTGYIFDNDSMISSVKDFPKAIVNLYGTASDLVTGDDEIEIERLVKDVDKVFITMSPFFDTPAALSSFSHLVRDLFMIGKNAID